MAVRVSAVFENIFGLRESVVGMESAICTEEQRGRMGQAVYDRIKGTEHSGVLSGYSAVWRSGRERSIGQGKEGGGRTD